MRSKELISQASPCDVNFRDRSLQSIASVKAGGHRYCANLEQCKARSQAEGIQCTLRLAQQMAIHILSNRSPFNQAIQEERAAFLADPLDGQFWVYRNKEWHVIRGKESAIDDIVEFALIIIDRQPGERRPFTQDGKRQIILGPSDTLYNDMLDFDDIYGELGQRNPYRG